MIKRVERRTKINCILGVLIFLVILSNFFGSKIEIILRTKPNIAETNETQIHFIDVGQGDAIAIRFNNGEIMLVDSGTSDYRCKLQDYLNNIVLKSGKTIDYLVLTHPDNDHSGNMQFLVENYDIKTFYRPVVFEESEQKTPSCYNLTYRALLKSVQNRNINTKFNNQLNISKDDFSIHSYDVWNYISDLSKLGTNEFSPVIVVESNDKKVMLTGDISSVIEEQMILNYDQTILDVDILKLAHHGSKYSNSSEFLRATSPKYIVTNVGENSYGHPANETILRILQYDNMYNTHLYQNAKDTLSDGNIIYTLDDIISIETIDNIDNYNFVSYHVYSIILIFVLSYFILLPYIEVWRKNNIFINRNKNFKKLKK